VKQFIEDCKEYDEFTEESQQINANQANKLIQQTHLNKQLEQSNTALSLKNEQQADKLEKISKDMDTIQAEMDAFEKSTQEYKQQIKKAENTIFYLKAILILIVVMVLGLSYKEGIF
jgi:molecular chaperone GrpE (heat shock protein)